MCQVDIGKRVVTLVTGASNVTVGRVVPVVTEGGTLADGTIIEATDFRGIASGGMLLSADEIGLEKKSVPLEQREGIFLFSCDTEVGLDVVQVLGLDDFVLELDLTPNRADCLGMLGVATEVAAILNLAVVIPPTKEIGEIIPSSSFLKIEVLDNHLCPGYMALVLDDVQISESPLWLMNALMAVGMRPINNLVDITNYVMWELGQPLHAFDYHKLNGETIVVRQSLDGEHLVTLDGEKRVLPEGTLVIADCANPVAIAGVMGGLHSEVGSATTKIVIESAWFDLVSIRKTSRAIGLRSEASARFDKGIDPAGLYKALGRVAYLVELIGCGHVVMPTIGNIEAFEKEREVLLRPGRVNSLLGTSISPEE
ncbi:MAG: phenylalanine--tRNA ligase subunit beta, partial [bacterium]|nr:phenylalanine--tRNA ligase subunit beta [bacterium]